ncbi:chaperone protein [Auricularia subglabra TFB-10046 SS5]|nr:chaperone protein [Auricularia subglabra TFB-10046 SS5]
MPHAAAALSTSLGCPQKRSRDEAILICRIAEAADRFEDMLNYVRIFTALGDGDLSINERSLVSIAFQNNMSRLRRSRRILLSIQGATPDERTKGFIAKVEAEILALGNEVLGLLEKGFLPRASNDEAKVFYIKMQADHRRYLAETFPSDASQAQLAKVSYDSAVEIASRVLLSTDPLRLGLLLNASVFQYDIMRDVRGAWTMAKDAFDEALEGLDTLSEERYREAVIVLKLLRENLQAWLPEVHALGSSED